MAQPTQLNPTEQDALVKQIGLALLRAAPADWHSISVDYRALGRYAEAVGKVTFADETTEELKVSPEIAVLFGRLRSGMYRDGRGTWYNARYQLDQPSAYSLEYDRDEPRWINPPPPPAYADDLRTFPRDEQNVPEWLMRRMAGLKPPFRVARIFDGPGAGGRPVINRPPIDEGERDDILRYLDGAPLALPARGFDTDHLDDEGRQSVPVAFHTDGAWIWPAAVNYYLRTHGVPPDPDLLEHLRRVDFTLPEVEEAARSSAAAFLNRGPRRPPPRPAPAPAPAPAGPPPIMGPDGPVPPIQVQAGLKPPPPHTTEPIDRGAPASHSTEPIERENKVDWFPAGAEARNGTRAEQTARWSPFTDEDDSEEFEAGTPVDKGATADRRNGWSPTDQTAPADAAVQPDHHAAAPAADATTPEAPAAPADADGPAVEHADDQPPNWAGTPAEHASSADATDQPGAWAPAPADAAPAGNPDTGAATQQAKHTASDATDQPGSQAAPTDHAASDAIGQPRTWAPTDHTAQTETTDHPEPWAASPQANSAAATDHPSDATDQPRTWASTDHTAQAEATSHPEPWAASPQANSAAATDHPSDATDHAASAAAGQPGTWAPTDHTGPAEATGQPGDWTPTEPGEGQADRAGAWSAGSENQAPETVERAGDSWFPEGAPDEQQVNGAGPATGGRGATPAFDWSPSGKQAPADTWFPAKPGADQSNAPAADAEQAWAFTESPPRDRQDWSTPQRPINENVSHASGPPPWARDPAIGIDSPSDVAGLDTAAADASTEASPEQSDTEPRGDSPKDWSSQDTPQEGDPAREPHSATPPPSDWSSQDTDFTPEPQDGGPATEHATPTAEQPTSAGGWSPQDTGPTPEQPGDAAAQQPTPAGGWTAHDTTPEHSAQDSSPAAQQATPAGGWTAHDTTPEHSAQDDGPVAQQAGGWSTNDATPEHSAQDSGPAAQQATPAGGWSSQDSAFTEQSPHPDPSTSAGGWSTHDAEQPAQQTAPWSPEADSPSEAVADQDSPTGDWSSQDAPSAEPIHQPAQEPVAERAGDDISPAAVESGEAAGDTEAAFSRGVAPGVEAQFDQLRARLSSLGVPESRYRIGAAPEAPAWALEQTADGWRVGWFDTRFSAPHEFPDFADASAFLLGKVLLEPVDALAASARPALSDLEEDDDDEYDHRPRRPVTPPGSAGEDLFRPPSRPADDLFQPRRPQPPAATSGPVFDDDDDDEYQRAEPRQAPRMSGLPQRRPEQAPAGEVPAAATPGPFVNGSTPMSATGEAPMAGGVEQAARGGDPVRGMSADRPTNGTPADMAPKPQEWAIQPRPGDPPLTLFRGKALTELPPGTEIDRYGDPTGNLTYAAGTPFERRSLVPDWVSRPYRVYRVQRPTEALTGVAIPWFEQPGGGTAFVLGRSIAELIDSGHLVEIPNQVPPTRPQPGR